MRISDWRSDVCSSDLHHPRLGKYQHEHTRRWSESVAAADAFALVTQEYNFGPTPPLLNALTYVSTEWTPQTTPFSGSAAFSRGLPAVQLLQPGFSTPMLVPPHPQVMCPT